jgi:hypothetical protein
MLNRTSAAGTCVLFVNGTRKEDYDSVRTWLTNSRFNTYEASDLFDAIEEMYDFTGSQMPNVIMVRGTADADAVSGLTDERVFFYSPGEKSSGCIRDLHQLADELDTFFPSAAATKLASA